MRLKFIASIVAVLMGLATSHTPAEAQSFGHGVQAFRAGEFERAHDIWAPLAAAGDTSAQWGLGILYRRGEGVEQDHAAAFRWFQQSAQRGHAAAQNDLGMSYSRGWGVEQSLTMAHQWLLESAARGHPAGQYNLGHLYINGRRDVDGRPVPPDEAAGHRWLVQAAEQGHMAAQTRVGQHYLFGFGGVVEPDCPSAMHYLERASDAGDAMAKMALAGVYNEGRCRPRDASRTSALMSEAQAAESRPAQYRCPPPQPGVLPGAMCWIE